MGGLNLFLFCCDGDLLLYIHSETVGQSGVCYILKIPKVLLTRIPQTGGKQGHILKHAPRRKHPFLQISGNFCANSL